MPITLNMIADLTTCVNKKQRLHLRPKGQNFDAEDYDNFTSCEAQLSAATKLFSLATPLPAMSNAVP